ncbi:thioredoxin domain-containing protein [uncultured Corynebacterium sp.]|uniref:DsbA family protein n=1 Tax=uncultured Corynebacterium sp. TaxID=159447 RepID=UPI0025CDB1A4|nr:thioredoxin domain-containing protein [uncultured Corynebacterium sp.]
MSQKIKAPNEKNNGFLWGLVAIVVIAVVVIAVVVIQGRDRTDSTGIEAEDVNFSVSYADGTITLKSDGAAADAPVVDVYEDYACHHCADLVEADHADMKQALDDGKLVVNLETVNILDSDGNGGIKPGPATMGGAVQMAIAKSGNAEAFWAIHDYVFANQSDVARNWGYGDYADAAESLGVDKAVVDAIRDESVKDEYLDVLAGNVDSMKDRGVEGTPAIFVDGEEYQVRRDPNDANKIQNWVPDVVK